MASTRRGPTHCPNCGGGPLRKAITAAAVHYKGSGWAKKERRATVASGRRRAATARSADDGSKADARTTAGDGDAPRPTTGSDNPIAGASPADRIDDDRRSRPRPARPTKTD